jgi:hypothetical protein
MAWVKIENGVVVQKNRRETEGFIEADDSVVCGYLYDGEAFTAPDIPEVDPAPEPSPLEKLTAFLAANPDVAALIG